MTLHEIDLFIALLENGLLDRRVRTLTGKTPTPQEWEHIYEAARIHAVSAVLFDGLQTLPPEWRPPRPLYLQWAARTVQIEQANLRLQEVTARIVECYDQAGLHPVLLKGSSIGRHYPNPLHRQCGDIDLYIGKRDFARANRLLEQLGGVVTAETADKHSHYLLEGVHVENHRRLLPMGNPLHTRRLRKMIAGVYPHGSDHSLAFEGVVIPTFPAPFAVCYAFLHAVHHLLSSGIGLRHVCDYAILLHTHHSASDRAWLTRAFGSLGMQRMAAAFEQVIRFLLKMDPGEFPAFPRLHLSHAQQTADEELLLSDILESGNFGKYDERITPRPRGYWAGKWHTFRRATTRARRFHRLLPSQTRWYALQLVKGTLTIQWNKLRRRLHG